MSVLGANNLNSVNKLVCDVFTVGFSARMNVWDKVFNRRVPTRKDELTTVIKLDNNVTQATDGGEFTANDIVEIGAYTITQLIFKDKITLGDFAEEFDNYGAIQKASREKGEDYKYYQDELAVAFLNNPTSTTAPYGFQVNGSSDTPLLANSQPIGDTGTNQDNLITGGLSKENLLEGRKLLRNMKRHNGNKGGFQSRRLITPVDEYPNAWELTYSAKEPEGAENNDNFVHKMGIMPIEWDLLTDANQCFLMDSMETMPYWMYMIKKDAQVRSIINEATGNVEYQYKMMLQAGVSDYLRTVGIGA